MVGVPERSPDPAIRALTGDISRASDAKALLIVDKVDALISRGATDGLVAPLRRRLSTLRAPRPLRFGRLLFQPLHPLIVPANRWQAGDGAIPRTALTRMADHVHHAMGEEVKAIESRIAGRATTDTALITSLGQSVWPAAARILRADAIPESWSSSGLSDITYRALANSVAALLEQAGALDAICDEARSGFIPVRAEAIAAILAKVAAADQAAVPMLLALLLIRVPEAAASVPTIAAGLKSVAIQAALHQAVDRLLLHLDQDQGTEAQIAAGTLADAGAATSRIRTLLQHVDIASSSPQRRVLVRRIRQHLDASCKARFTLGLQEEFLTPLDNLTRAPDPISVQDLEAAARRLRSLEMEARTVGSAPTYDLLLKAAAESAADQTMRHRLTPVDQVRLVELLCGPDAALAMLDSAQ